MPQPADRPSITPAPGVQVYDSGEALDDRPKPLDPTIRSRRGMFLLTVRTLSGLHPPTSTVRTVAQLQWREKHPAALCSLLEDLRTLLWLRNEGFIAQQAGLPSFGHDTESTWTATETPYWKPGDAPRLVKPPRKKRKK